MFENQTGASLTAAQLGGMMKRNFRKCLVVMGLLTGITILGPGLSSLRAEQQVSKKSNKLVGSYSFEEGVGAKKVTITVTLTNLLKDHFTLERKRHNVDRFDRGTFTSISRYKLDSGHAAPVKIDRTTQVIEMRLAQYSETSFFNSNTPNTNKVVADPHRQYSMMKVILEPTGKKENSYVLKGYTNYAVVDNEIEWLPIFGDKGVKVE